MAVDHGFVESDAGTAHPRVRSGSFRLKAVVWSSRRVDHADMAGPPSGTVTMLFSDIEGSTLLLNRLGGRYLEALEGQRSVLRGAWDRAGGHEMGTEGDSFFVVFERARDAALAAVDAQRGLSRYSWPDDEQVRVRMGMHTGEPVAHEDGYVGIDVHRAARVAAVAHGGQIVLTDATSRLLAASLPEGAWLDDLGLHRLKDLAVPEHLFQLSADGMDVEFPPVRSLGTAAGLPLQLVPLIGRGAELRHVGDLLAADGVRLITLTGPGGSGKTRLSIAAASEVGDSYADGVHFVGLSSTYTAESMWIALADVLGGPGAARTRERLLARLANQHQLIVLDNLEQIPDAGTVVAELLGCAAGVTVLATSRRPLHLHGEHEILVPPLSLRPDDDGGPSEAVQMFCQHATMVRSTFDLDDQGAVAVEAICRRLDALPLALELAAARSRMLSPTALLARLDAAVTPLSGADRPERHRSLHDTIAWSYDLLSPELQTVFRRLGAFAGPVDLDAVRAVCSPDADPLDTVAELADASLIQVADGIDNEPTVSLLQTVRGFARECLAESGELDATRERHARHFLELAERLSPQLHSALQLTAAERLSAADEDFDHALDWALRPGGAPPLPSRVTVGLRLIAALWWYWTANGHLSARRRWCERAIEVAPDGDSSEKAATLHALELQNSWEPDPDPGLPRTRIEEALTMYQRLRDLGGMSDVANTLAQLCDNLGETSRAYELYESAIAWALEAGDDVRRASAMHYFADLLYDSGEVDRAIAMVEQARDLATELGDERDALHREKWLAMLLLEEGHVAEARARLYRLLPGVQRARQPALSISTVGSFAVLFLALGDAERAARVSAAYETLGIAFGWPATAVAPSGDEEQQRDALRDAMGAAAWDRAWDEGRTWTAQQALAYIARSVLKAQVTREL